MDHIWALFVETDPSGDTGYTFLGWCEKPEDLLLKLQLVTDADIANDRDRFTKGVQYWTTKREAVREHLRQGLDLELISDKTPEQLDDLVRLTKTLLGAAPYIRTLLLQETDLNGDDLNVYYIEGGEDHITHRFKRISKDTLVDID